MRKLLVTSALLAASVTANADVLTLDLTNHRIGRANNAPSESLINPPPNAFANDTGNIPEPSFTFDTTTGILTAGAGTLHLRSQTNPFLTGRVFDRYIDGLSIDTMAGAGAATAFNCENFPEVGSPSQGVSPAGGFGANVGANICGNYTLGADFVDQSTVTFGPGTLVARVIGGDDVIAGAPQSIDNYDLSLASNAGTVGGQLILESADWIDQPATPTNSAGTQMVFNITAITVGGGTPTATDDSVEILEGVAGPVAVDVLSNDTGFDDPVTVTISTPATNGGTATVASGSPGPKDDVVINFTPAGGAVAGDTYTFGYTITANAGAQTDTATVTVTIAENVAPVGADGSITLTPANGLTTTGTVDLAPLGFVAGNTPAAFTFTQPAGGVCSITGTTLSFDPNDDFVGGGDAAAGGDTAVCAYTVTDSDGQTASGSVNVTITDVQPSLADAAVTTEQDVASPAVALTVTPGNGSVAQHTLAVTTNGTQGSCAITGTSVTYTPNAEVFGTDTCTLTLTDADGDADTATVNVTIEEVSNEIRLPGGGSSLDLLSVALLGGLPLLRRRRRG